MLNNIVLMGRLVADPKLKQTPSGVSVATFRIAVDRDYQDKNTGQRQADFIPCVAWRQTGEFVTRYFSKGKMIALEGSLQSRAYEDKNGQKRTAYEVIVGKVSFCGDTAASNGHESNQGNSYQAPAKGAPQAAQPGAQFNSYAAEHTQFGSFEEYLDDGDDLPF